MEFGSIDREIHVEASPEVVYEVVSRPEHLRQWWPDDVDVEPVVDASGFVSFGDPTAPNAKVVPITVVEADPPRRFAFRWAYEAGQVPTVDNSLLVTFDLEPSGTGTRLRFCETGFRERGWDVATLEEQYRAHAQGWDTFLPRLQPYAASVGVRS